ncbi:MAG: two pore domain potassium channel family protein [Cytophagales bacterium]|nr:two pore domain potassium channel family protein [Cytophagales bacterium]
MNIILLLIGVIIVAVTNMDALSTILRINGGSKISNFVARNVWRISVFVSRKFSRTAILSNVGALIVVTLFSLWAVLLMIGYGLIYNSYVHSIVETSTELPASITAKFYYVGYTLTSLGNGDLKTGNDFWRIISNFTGLNGMFLLSIAISYFIPLMNAVVKQRMLATFISNLGDTPTEIISNGWNGTDFNILHEQFKELYPMILMQCEQQLAYPVLLYFHSENPKYSPQLNLAKLDEALSIQEVYNIDQSDKAYIWKNLRMAMNKYLKVIKNSYSFNSEPVPDFPYKNKLPSLIRDIPKETADYRLTNIKERRAFIASLVKNDGWKWEEFVD